MAGPISMTPTTMMGLPVLAGTAVGFAVRTGGVEADTSGPPVAGAEAARKKKGRRAKCEKRAWIGTGSERRTIALHRREATFVRLPRAAIPIRRLLAGPSSSAGRLVASVRVHRRMTCPNTLRSTCRRTA